MTTVTLHVFGVSSSIKEADVIEKVSSWVGKTKNDITSSFYNKEKESLKIEFANLKEQDVESLKSCRQKFVSLNSHVLPIVINEEVFSETVVQFSHDLYEFIFKKQHPSGNSFVDPQSFFVNLKLTRPSEDGPWDLEGSISNLYKFEQKVNQILGLKKSIIDSKSVSCSTDAVNNPLVQNVASGSHGSSDVIPKSTDHSVNTFNGELPNDVLSNQAPQLSLLRDETKLHLKIGNDLNVSIFVGDITKENVKAIVNPVYESKEPNNHLKRNACAQSLMGMNNMAKKPYIVGHTDYHIANGLRCDRVIDVNLPSFEFTSDDDADTFLAPDLRNCYASCIIEAKHLEVKSIAFQPLACDLFDGAAKLSAACATEAILNFVHGDNLGTINDIRFVIQSEDVARIFVKIFFDLFSALDKVVDVKIISTNDAPFASANNQANNSKADNGPSTSNGRRKSLSSKVAPGFESMPKRFSSADADCVDESEKMDFDSAEPEKAGQEKDVAINGPVAAAAAAVHLEECPICLNELGFNDQTKELPKCRHKFHVVCIDQWLQTKNSCPLCQTRFGLPQGNQPQGSMQIRVVNSVYVAGFKDSKGCIEICYNFPNGIQGPNHPNPGTPYSGTHRVAYLPNNARGQLICKLLRKAFDCKLIFTVGTSVTTGVQNTVVWNNIHHKTTLGNSPYGYPDPTYLDRVEDELRAAGIDKSML